jgi:hypothetical protein
MKGRAVWSESKIVRSETARGILVRNWFEQARMTVIF